MNGGKKTSGERNAFARKLLAWVLAIAIAETIVALPTDVVLLLVHKAGIRAAFACGLASASLGAFLAFIVAPIVVLVAGISRRIRARRSRLRWLWPAPLLATAWLSAALLIGALPHYTHPRDTVVTCSFTLAIFLAAIASRTPRRVAVAASIVAIIALWATDIAMSQTLIELRDLLGLATVCWVVTLATPIRARLEHARTRVVMGSLLLVCASSALVIASIDRAAPGWRVRSWQYGRYEERLERAARTLVDFDGDGFSPVAWGSDCNDLDPTRNPYAHEGPGLHDANCNGVTPSEQPTDDDRGLAPANGEPALAASVVDRVLLVTIDCARADTLRADVMPELTAFATRGITFDRLYAGATRTAASLPLMMRGTLSATPLAAILGREKIPSAAIVAWRDDAHSASTMQDFTRQTLPDGQLARFDAEHATDLALAEMRATRGTRAFTWVHYFDAHAPIQVVLPPGPPPFAVTPKNLDASFATYLYALTLIDHQLGRIFDDLVQSGELARTMVIVTSDHGEGFGPHGVMYHAVSGYEPIVHVPGVFVAPGVAPGHYTELATHRDILPTALGALGLDARAREAEVFGRSWLRIRDGAQAPLHRFVVIQSLREAGPSERVAPLGALVDARFKLIETFEDGLLEMYDTRADPGEESDLVPADSDDVRRLRHDLALFRDVDRWP